jgi:hypothetical protein
MGPEMTDLFVRYKELKKYLKAMKKQKQPGAQLHSPASMHIAGTAASSATAVHIVVKRTAAVDGYWLCCCSRATQSLATGRLSQSEFHKLAWSSQKPLIRQL